VAADIDSTVSVASLPALPIVAEVSVAIRYPRVAHVFRASDVASASQPCIASVAPSKMVTYVTATVVCSHRPNAPSTLSTARSETGMVFPPPRSVVQVVASRTLLIDDSPHPRLIHPYVLADRMRLAAEGIAHENDIELIACAGEWRRWRRCLWWRWRWLDSTVIVQLSCEQPVCEVVKQQRQRQQHAASSRRSAVPH